MPLIGIMYGNVISALTTFIAYKYDLVQTMSSWTVANFASVLQGNYEILYLAVPACLLAYFYARQFSAASVGEALLRTSASTIRRLSLLASSWLQLAPLRS
ncbi:catechol siderophore ABC transporter permease component [Vibrio maritimus]|uniref:Catechol siderophore ABC transporter permease component n=1 Tax=Vibrio maritimus TaxID=990268 RepID=A0A090TEA9_9VIBR|nr:catechol siderophore ABC transporter permease component [Vibrio maritimus]